MDNKILVQLEITNADEIIAATKRITEITNELSVIAYRLQPKVDIKKNQSSAGTND